MTRKVGLGKRPIYWEMSMKAVFRVIGTMGLGNIYIRMGSCILASLRKG
jgi:hypothetical protein